MPKKSGKELILKVLKEKSSLKQDVFHKNIHVFEELKSVIKEIVADLKQDAQIIDKRILVDYSEKGPHEIELKVAGDVLFFHMHTNVFEFDKSHSMWKTSYVRDNPTRSFCGMIYIYNFLADSFKYNRANDVGYMIARIFTNTEMHYFVEGKRQLGFLYNDFPNKVIDKLALKNIVESAIIYALDFDLYTPPFDEMQEVSVSQILEASENMRIKTGKRLGFRFQADSDQID
ncbi:MAG: hypothetical protein EPN85_06220 [Bacteroidetes bacterium]|nr:MAG: hypothetical protein EPN85_06220 [Bacteroidota bacterium]